MGVPARKFFTKPETEAEVAQQQPPVGAQPLAQTILQSVSIALDGPRGIDPASLMTALGALAGYSARWIIMSDIRDGKQNDDFKVPLGTNQPFISISPSVSNKVASMNEESFASVLVSAMMASNANWLPDVPQTVMHNFMAINSPTYPDYSFDKAYWPKIPPQTLLMMLWEDHVRMLRSKSGAKDVAMKAHALAVTEAAKAYGAKYPMKMSGQLALETAIAMSKIKYAF